MGYKQLIDSNLIRAFNMLKDLAVDAQFTRRTGQGFNFGTGVVSTTPENLIVKIVRVEEKKKNSQRNTAQQTLMLKTAQIGEVKQNDYFTISAEIWTVSAVPKNDGFITVVEVTKEK